MTETAYDRLVAALESRGNVKPTGQDQAVAQCPAHDDDSPSLSLRSIEGQALVYCHAGCDVRAVVEALGWSLRDLYDERQAEYRYDSGRVVHRGYDHAGRKKFRQSGDTRKVELYHLDRLHAAGPGAVYLVEGEKDVHAIEAAGGVATTAPMGAANIGKCDLTPLHGRDVVAIADHDLPGLSWAHKVRELLDGKAATLRFGHAKEGNDPADHIAAGHGLRDWERLDLAPVEAAAQLGAVTVRMSDVKPEQIDWLWHGHLALGKLHIIDGDPGLGKSTITVAWSATITTGGFWPDGTRATRPRGVVILSAEDGLADTIRPRLDAHGADPARVVALTAVRHVDKDTGDVYEVPPVLPTDLTALESAIRQVDADMVIIDPLMAYLGADTNSYRDQDVRRALAPLAKLAERLGVAVVIIRHLRKSKGSAVHSGGGSIGIIGAARIGYTVGEDPADEARYVIACSKINIGVKPPARAYRLAPDELHGCARVEWLGVVELSADQLTAERDQGERSALGEAQEWLLGYLTDQGGEAARPDVMKAAAAAGHSRATIERAQGKSKVGYRTGGFPRSSVWIHPDGLQSPQAESAGGHEVTAVTGLTSGNTPSGTPVTSYLNTEVTEAAGDETVPDWTQQEMPDLDVPF